MTKIVFLGTNGWFSTKTGNTTSALIDSDSAYIILDAGNGIKDVGRYITDDSKPIYLFLSHFHLDHISGLHTLNLFRFKQPLTVCCFSGGKEILDTVIRQPFTISLDKLPYPVNVVELDEGEHTSFPFKVTSKEVKHSTRCFGYRFEIDGKTVSFCTDTGLCDSAYELSSNVDVLITECAFLPGESNPNWPHLNPTDAATLAKDSKAQKLVLMHFDAEKYPTLEKRDEAQAIAKEIFSNSVSAKDGLIIEL